MNNGGIPQRQDITVLPPDDPNKKVEGWFFKEIEGICVIDGYPFLPWYKKIFKKRFWRYLSYKLIRRKGKEVRYTHKMDLG